MRARRIKGSFTVEAVFIMPIVLVVIFCLLYMSLILHDKVVLQSVIEEAEVRCNQLYHQPSDVLTSEIHYSKLLDVSLLGEDKEKHKQELQYYIAQEIAGKLYICEVSKVTINLDGDSCSIVIEADSKIRLSVVSKLLGSNGTVTVSGKREYHHPENFARMAENILGTATQIKGTDQITEFLGKVGGYLGGD